MDKTDKVEQRLLILNKLAQQQTGKQPLSLPNSIVIWEENSRSPPPAYKRWSVWSISSICLFGIKFSAYWSTYLIAYLLSLIRKATKAKLRGKQPHHIVIFTKLLETPCALSSFVCVFAKMTWPQQDDILHTCFKELNGGTYLKYRCVKCVHFRVWFCVCKHRDSVLPTETLCDYCWPNYKPSETAQWVKQQTGVSSSQGFLRSVHNWITVGILSAALEQKHNFPTCAWAHAD